MKITIAWIPWGDRTNPGSRLRVFDVADALAKNGVAQNVFPPFRFSEPPTCVVLEKICDPNSLAFFEQAKKAGSRCLYDLCDPIWLQENVNRQRRWDVEKAIHLADEVLTPSSVMLSEIVRRHPKAKCRHIPDTIEMNAPQLKTPRNHFNSSLLRIGWIGTISNMEYIHLAAGALRTLNRSRPLVFRLITAAYRGMIPALPEIPVEFVPWTIEGYAARIAECDIMVIPVPLNEWTRGKSPNRLQLCLALGVPAVVSPLPSFLELLDGHGDIAYVARSEMEWLEHLTTLLDPDLRNRVGTAGRALIQREHSLDRWIGVWEMALRGKPCHAESAETSVWQQTC